MDITLNKEQKDIVKEARRFLTKECPFDYVQEMYADEIGFTDDIWKKIGTDHRIEMLLVWGCNSVISTASREILDDTLKKIPFTVVSPAASQA